MGLTYPSLDDVTRSHMVAEIQHDMAAGLLYVSKRLTERGQRAWPGLLTRAATEFDDDWLTDQIVSEGYIRGSEERRSPSGPVTARVRPGMLTEGEFNRYYIRAVCLRALQLGNPEVEIIRGKVAHEPRPDSERRIGSRLGARDLLEDLRTSTGRVPQLGIGRPNSHLTVRLLSESEDLL